MPTSSGVSQSQLSAKQAQIRNFGEQSACPGSRHDVGYAASGITDTSSRAS
jgi:hypothetical protein